MATSSLKKQLKLYDVFAICTGAMFSSGFFLLPGIAASQTGDSVFLAYLASGILIIPAMLSVAELSTAMPKAGGTYYFLDRSLGPMLGTIGGLGSWIALMFKSAFALIGMGAYLAIFIDVPITALALILTILFGILNIFGAKETTVLQRILVTVLVTIMGFFIIQGLASLQMEALQIFSSGKDGFFKSDLHGFISTIGLVFVSYAGLTKITSVAEEVENPDRNIPIGMFLSLATATIIYVAGVFVMQTVLSPAEFSASLTPVADAGEKFMHWLPGSTGIILIVIAAVAAFASTGNAGIMSASRYPFAMAKDKLVHPRFSTLSKQGTPTFAIIVTVLLMLGILLLFDVEAVAKLASAFQLLLFGLICLAVIVMRESNIDSYQPGFRSPFYPWVQIVGMFITVWLVAEMGFLAVSLTGFIIILCIGWYIYYAKDRLKRKGAIFHIHQRLGQQRYEALEFELLNILNEKNSDKHLSYKETIARSIVIDFSDQEVTISSILHKAADVLSGKTNIEKKILLDVLNEEYKSRFNKLGNGVLCSYLPLDKIEAPEMLVFRMPKKVDLEISGIHNEVILFVLLLVPSEEEGLDVRLVGHLAEIVNTEHFAIRVQKALSKKDLRETLLTDGHFAHLLVKEHPKLSQFAGRKLSEIALPESCLVAIIYRGVDVIVPHGNTEISEEDELLIIGQPNEIEQLLHPNKEA